MRKSALCSWLLGMSVLLLWLPASIHAQTPELTLLEPMAGATILGSTIQIICRVDGIFLYPTAIPLAEAGRHPEVNQAGRGHLLVRLDAGEDVVWESMLPYRFRDVAPGSHHVRVEIVQNDHSPLMPPAIAERDVVVQASGPVASNAGGTQDGTASSATPPTAGQSDDAATIPPAGAVMTGGVVTNASPVILPAMMPNTGIEDRTMRLVLMLLALCCVAAGWWLSRLAASVEDGTS